MRVKQIFILLVCILCITDLFGQSASSRINSIKRDTKYLYEDATAETEEDAYQMAYQGLTLRIQEYVNTKKKFKDADNILVNNIKQHCEQISMTRGDLFRVFLYVKISDIDPAENIEVIAKEEISYVEQTPVQEEQPAEPAAEAADEQVKTVFIDDIEKAWQRDAIKRLADSGNATKAQATLSRMKAEYKIKKYGALDTCSNIAASWIIVLDDDMNVVALLAPDQNGKRPDYISGTMKSLKDFSGYSAIWFTFA